MKAVLNVFMGTSFAFGEVTFQNCDYTEVNRHQAQIGYPTLI